MSAFAFPLFELIAARSSVAPIAAVTFDAAGDVYAAASPLGVELGTVRVRFRLNELPSSFAWIAGASNAVNNTGWLLCTEAGAQLNPLLWSRLVLYLAIDGTLTKLSSKTPMPADVGKMFTFHVVADGAHVWFYLDGKALFAGRPYATQDVDNYAFAVGSRNDGALTGHVSVSEVAVSPTALTPEQVAVDFAAALGTPLLGEAHRWTATEDVAATWPDAQATRSLAVAGAPVVETFTPDYANHRGPVEVYGDSIAAGRKVGLTTGDGWLRQVQRGMSDAGLGMTFIGPLYPDDPTLDWDFYYSAFPGEALSEKLPTLAASLAANGPVNASTVLAYGINDLVKLDRSSAQLQADVATAVGLIEAARPGRPIFVTNVLPVADGSASPGQHVQIAAYDAAFASMIATLQATVPNVVGVVTSVAVTDPNDTAQLFDGTHPTPLVYGRMADIIQAAFEAEL